LARLGGVASEERGESFVSCNGGHFWEEKRDCRDITSGIRRTLRKRIGSSRSHFIGKRCRERNARVQKGREKWGVPAEKRRPWEIGSCMRRGAFLLKQGAPKRPYP